MLFFCAHKISVVFLFLCVFFFVIGTIFLNQGCYSGIGNCSKFKKVNATILTNNLDNVKKNIKIDDWFGQYYENHQTYKIIGTYVHNDYNYNCTIYDTRNSGKSKTFVFSEYYINATQNVYFDNSNASKCYALNYIELNGEIGLAFVVFASILIIVLPLTLIIANVIKNKKEKEARELNDMVEIQLSTIFPYKHKKISWSNSNYIQLPTSDDEKF